MPTKSQLTPYERLNLNFIEYADEWTVLSMQIEKLELEGEDIELEMYERQYVLYDNLNFILERVVAIKPVPDESQC